MWIPDMPNVPPQDAPVMIAQANQDQSGSSSATRTLGVCAPSPNNNYSLENVSEPIHAASYYLEQIEKRSPPASATTTILQAPKHGVLRLVTEADGDTFGEGRFVPSDQLYVYLPDSNYVGNDTAIIQVDFGNGLKVNVKYYFQAINEGLSDDWMGDYCSKTGVYWKISSTLDANGNSTISVEHVAPASGTPDNTLTSDSLSAWLSKRGTDLFTHANSLTRINDVE